MRAVTLKEAKAHLNALVDAAQAGEQVVLMRGSKHVAAIVPLSAEELELAPRLTDAQADRFWKRLAADRSRGAAFGSMGQAVAQLGRVTARRPPPKIRKR